MNAQEVLSIIKTEIGSDWSKTNWHNVDLKQSLLPIPIKNTMEDSFDKGKFREVWLVLEEMPGAEEEYLIVYDEDRNQFALAYRSTGEADCIIGYTDTFLDAFLGM